MEPPELLIALLKNKPVKLQQSLNSCYLGLFKASAKLQMIIFTNKVCHKPEKLTKYYYVGA